jgi:hypothetical protein
MLKRAPFGLAHAAEWHRVCYLYKFSLTGRDTCQAI